ncbi:hypothetical protein HC256_005045 [Beauveria bassiana]|nr:hypothetical protein HC256_005045 [Beauveria bassiana]
MRAVVSRLGEEWSTDPLVKVTDPKSVQKAKKSMTYLTVALAGSPNRSSNQNDLQLPVTMDPAVSEVIDRISETKRRSWKARRRDTYQLRPAGVFYCPPFDSFHDEELHV